MKKLFSALLFVAFALALPAAGAATTEKVQVQPDKAIATAPPTATRFILAAAAAKAKPAAKAKDGAKAKAKAKKKAVKKEAKVKKTGTGFKLKPTAPVMA